MNKISLVLLSLVAIAIWLGGAYFIWHWDRLPALPQRGQFGDMFGALTSLFSVLGFIGVLYTLHEQQTQMERADASTTAERHAAGFERIYEILEDSDAVRTRTKVAANIRSLGRAGDETLRSLAEEVCSDFDFAGVMCAKGDASTQAVMAAWGPHIKEFWRMLEVVVKSSQKTQPSARAYFEWLAGQPLDRGPRP